MSLFVSPPFLSLVCTNVLICAKVFWALNQPCFSKCYGAAEEQFLKTWCSKQSVFAPFVDGKTFIIHLSSHLLKFLHHRSGAGNMIHGSPAMRTQSSLHSGWAVKHSQEWPERCIRLHLLALSSLSYRSGGGSKCIKEVYLGHFRAEH